MEYCPKRKLAFFFPARTGSTTFEYFLRSWGTKDPVLNHQKYTRHWTPKEVFDARPDLSSYQRYGFFRNPLSRFISAARQIKKMSPHYVVGKDIKDYPKIFSIMFVQQYIFLEGGNVLDFDNYEDEINKVGRLFGQTKIVVPKTNSSEKVRLFIPDDIEDFVREFHKEDYKFAKEILGKEYLNVS